MLGIIKCSCLVLLLTVNYASSSTKVPLLMWTNIKDLSCERSHQSLTESVSSLFSKEYLNCLTSGKPEEIILFVYDKLGIEDITLYGQDTSVNNGFANLKVLSKTLPSLAAPAVEPSDIIEDLFDKFKNAAGNAKVKVVRLPTVDRSNPETTLSGLQQADQEILKTVSATKKNYIAIVTSENTVGQARYTRDVSGRQLLAADVQSTVNNTVFLIGKCVYMSFQGLNMTVYNTLTKKGPYSVILNITNDDQFAKESCLPPNVTVGDVNVTMTFTAEPKDFSDIEIVMVFNRNYSSMSTMYWWTLADVYVSFTSHIEGVASETNLALRSALFRPYITAPANMSYVCAVTPRLDYRDLSTAPDAKKRNITLNLRFFNWQVQPFDTKNFTFNKAVDCVGWYTEPIWSGLIVALVIVGILTCGLGMISQVTTMDRFDDPKGKTISVPQETS